MFDLKGWIHYTCRSTSFELVPVREFWYFGSIQCGNGYDR